MRKYTTRLRVSRARNQPLKIRRSSVPLQTVLCVFDQVSTIQAQQWIVAGFGELLAPRVWIPVKVGDAPPPESFRDAWATELEVDRGRNYRYRGEDDQAAAAEERWPESGPVDFVVNERPVDERYAECLAMLDRHMRSEHAPAAVSSSGGGSRSSVPERARNFFRSLTSH